MGYHLFTKTRFWEETHAKVDSLSLQDLNNSAAKIKITGKCSNPAIFTLERQVQIIAFRFPHFFAKCAKQSLFIKALMTNDGMFTIWITLNPSDLWSFLVLILAGVQLGGNGSNAFAEEFRRATATMNPVAVAQFYEATCTGIFKRLLAAQSTKGK